MNLADIVVLLIVAAAVFFAVRRARKNRGGCSCGCSGCARPCPGKKQDKRASGTDAP